MNPPPVKRPAGRPRKQRIKASGELEKRGPYQCKTCFKFGHLEKGCYATQAELEQELPPPHPKKTEKAKVKLSYTTISSLITVEASTKGAKISNIVADPKLPLSPRVTTRSMASLSPASPSVTTWRAASISLASLGVTTRRMASISPGGINHRLIIE
ncbi:hypothetical protein BS78_K118700 [Paspalum vaginatum]|uniref:Uncharacterized protein n=1 Tax=Paspalum vaginatum TaxID=158149 RepID=A0A9W7X8T3_9POAL|nr:hypothetical protein BS78_K118700 [Paspalum vaginatum]